MTVLAGGVAFVVSIDCAPRSSFVHRYIQFLTRIYLSCTPFLCNGAPQRMGKWCFVHVHTCVPKALLCARLVRHQARERGAVSASVSRQSLRCIRRTPTFRSLASHRRWGGAAVGQLGSLRVNACVCADSCRYALILPLTAASFALPFMGPYMVRTDRHKEPNHSRRLLRVRPNAACT